MGTRTTVPTITVSTEVEVDIHDLLDDLDNYDLQLVIDYCRKALAGERPSGLTDTELFWQEVHEVCRSNNTERLMELLREQLWATIGKTF